MIVGSPAHRLLRHALFWLAMVAYFLLPQWIYPEYRTTVRHYFFRFDYRASPGFLPILFGYTLGMGMLYTYAFRDWVLPPLLRSRYAVSLVRYGLLTVGVCYGFRMLKAWHVAWLDPWLRHQPSRPIDPRHLSGLFLHQVYLYEYSTVVVLVTIYTLYVNWRRSQQAVHRLTQQRVQHDIQLLKTRLNPGLLLTSLDRLYALIHDHPDLDRAPAFVLTLANFLSYVLYRSGAERVPLTEDTDALRQYVALKQEQVGGRMDVSIQLTGEMAGQTTPPLLWLPLLENAFQHGLTVTDQAWLSVQLARRGTAWHWTIVNGIEPDGPAEASGQGGLTDLRRRLDAHYPGRYKLTLKRAEGLFIASLTLPAESIPAGVNGTLTSQPDLPYASALLTR